METQRRSIGRPAPGRDGGASQIVTVAVPQRHEGIGNALRKSFAAPGDGLPGDFLRLLAKLD